MGDMLCPKCNEWNPIRLHTDDMDTFDCLGCDEQFTCADVQTMIEAAQKWQTLLAWVQTAPKLPAK